MWTYYYWISSKNEWGYEIMEFQTSTCAESGNLVNQTMSFCLLANELHRTETTNSKAKREFYFLYIWIWTKLFWRSNSKNGNYQRIMGRQSSQGNSIALFSSLARGGRERERETFYPRSRLHAWYGNYSNSIGRSTYASENIFKSSILFPSWPNDNPYKYEITSCTL